MSEISRNRSIKAEPQAIWDVLADFGALSSWATGIDHSSLMNHGSGGSQLGTTRRVQMGSNAVVERITDFYPPSDLAYDVEGLPTLLGTVSNRWTLRRAGDTTSVTVTSTVNIGTNPIVGLAERAFCRVMAKQSDSMLAGLAKRMENTHV